MGTTRGRRRLCARFTRNFLHERSDGGGVPTVPAMEFREPTAAEIHDMARRELGLVFANEQGALLDLAAIGLTNGSWRNTLLEDIHAGADGGPGISDADMMRFNIATFRTVRAHLSLDEIAWEELLDALTDPERPLPGRTTVEVVAGASYQALAESIEDQLNVAYSAADSHGIAFALRRFAIHGGLACRGWYGTPWWPETVDVFIEELADPQSRSWQYDDRSRPEPAAVRNRDRLRGRLRDKPETLSRAAVRWCLVHLLGYYATPLGFARWRLGREPDWESPFAEQLRERDADRARRGLS
jgi:hypothetical protein